MFSFCVFLLAEPLFDSVLIFFECPASREFSISGLVISVAELAEVNSESALLSFALKSVSNFGETSLAFNWSLLAGEIG